MSYKPKCIENHAYITDAYLPNALTDQKGDNDAKKNSRTHCMHVFNAGVI